MEVVVAAVLCGAALIDTTANAWHDGGTVSRPMMLVAVTAAYGAVLCRHRRPVAATAVVVTATATSMMVSSLYWWVVPAPMISLYHLAMTTSDRRRILVTGGLTALAIVGVPVLVTSTSRWDAPWPHGVSAAVAAACGLALAVGDATRSRRAYTAEVERRAQHAERGREQEARRRVTEERLRIARDLHDTLGHHIALINAQAGMAELVFETQPVTAREALGHIRQTSRDALDDLRETIGLLRQPDEPTAPTEPTVWISGIDDLIATFRKSGMQVAHHSEGRIRPLPTVVSLTAYRVVQESLTNVRKHAGGATARVRLSFRPEVLHIVVEDEGTGHPPVADLQGPQAPHHAGHGIAGMRERVSAIGGSFDVGPRPGGGFRISAALPLAEDGQP